MKLGPRILQALIDYENAKPRNQQVRLGPSELGGCREYIRNVMIGTPQQGSDVWPTAAVMGTLMGAHMEDVCQQYMGALTEVPVTTVLSNGIKISGHADIVLVEDNAVVDAKTKNELHEVLRDGSSLDNKVQISVYTLGLVQSGVLTEGASAHLIYVDRSGMQQFVHETVLEWSDILGYAEVAVDRIGQVIEAQDQIEAGNLDAAHDLRDKTPPFCFSERVMCPFRDLCWQGSEWLPNEVITDPDVIADVAKFVAVRAEMNAATTIKKEVRERLIGVSGLTPDGYSVVWSGSERSPALYVTKVK